MRHTLCVVLFCLVGVANSTHNECPVEKAFDFFYHGKECEPKQSIDVKVKIPSDAVDSKVVAVEFDEAPWTQFRFAPHSTYELSTIRRHDVVTSRLFVHRTQTGSRQIDTLLLCLFLGLRDNSLSTSFGTFLVLKFKSNPYPAPARVNLPLLSFEYHSNGEASGSGRPSDLLLGQPEVVDLLLQDERDVITAVDWTLTDGLDVIVAAAGPMPVKLSLHKLNTSSMFLSSEHGAEANNIVNFGAESGKHPVSALYRTKHGKSEYMFFAHTDSSMEVYSASGKFLGRRTTNEPIVSFLGGGVSGRIPYFITPTRIGQVRVDVLSNRTDEWFATCKSPLWNAAPLFASTRSLAGGHKSSSNSLVQNFAVAFPDGLIGLFSARRESYRSLQCSELGYFRVSTVHEGAAMAIHGQCLVGEYLVVLVSAAVGSLSEELAATTYWHLAVYEIPIEKASTGKKRDASPTYYKYAKSSTEGFMLPSSIRQTATYSVNVLNHHNTGAAGTAALACETWSAHEAIASVTGPNSAVEVVHMYLPLTSAKLVDPTEDAAGGGGYSSWAAGSVDFTRLLRGLTPIPVVLIIAFQAFKHISKYRRRGVDDAEAQVALKRYESYRSQLDSKGSNKERRVKFSSEDSSTVQSHSQPSGSSTRSVLDNVVSAEEIATGSPFGKWGDVSNSLFNARMRAAKEIRKRPLLRPQRHDGA